MRRRNSRYASIVFGCALTLCVGSLAFGKDAEPSLGQIADRLVAIKNITAEYHRQTIHNPDPHLVASLPLGAAHPTARTESFEEQLRFLEGSLLYSRAASKVDLDAAARAKDSIFKLRVEIFTPKRVESVAWRTEDEKPVGKICVKDSIPAELILDVALGLRFEMSGWQWVTADRIKAANLVVNQPNDVTVRLRDQEGNSHVLHFAPEFGLALSHYHLDFTDGMFEDIECSDFRRVGNLMLPFTVTRQSTYQDSFGKPRNPIVTTLTVENYIVDDPENVPDQFYYRWPKGSAVLDTRNGEQFDIEKDGVILTDAEITRRLQEREARKQRKLEDAKKGID